MPEWLKQEDYEEPRCPLCMDISGRQTIPRQRVLEKFDEINPSVSGLLQGSNAFVIEEKNILLMIVRNRLFKRLFTQADAVSLGSAAAQVLGKKYAIRNKCVESEEDKTAPTDVLLERAKAQGIAVEAQQEPS